MKNLYKKVTRQLGFEASTFYLQADALTNWSTRKTWTKINSVGYRAPDWETWEGEFKSYVVNE